MRLVDVLPRLVSRREVDDVVPRILTQNHELKHPEQVYLMARLSVME